jgi:hypothetical protein
LKAWDSYEQALVDLPDPPEEISLRDIWVETKITQRYARKWSGVNSRVKRAEIGLASLWAIVLLILSALVAGGI